MNIELLQAAAAVNMVAMVKNHLRYEWLRSSSNDKLASELIADFADHYLDAAIDQAMADESLRAAAAA